MSCYGHLNEFFANPQRKQKKSKLRTNNDLLKLTRQIRGYLEKHPETWENKRVTLTLPESYKEQLRCDETCRDYPDCAIRIHLNFPEYCYYKTPKRVAGGKNV